MRSRRPGVNCRPVLSAGAALGRSTIHGLPLAASSKACRWPRSTRRTSQTSLSMTAFVSSTSDLDDDHGAGYAQAACHLRKRGWRHPVYLPRPPAHDGLRWPTAAQRRPSVRHPTGAFVLVTSRSAELSGLPTELADLR